MLRHVFVVLVHTDVLSQYKRQLWDSKNHTWIWSFGYADEICISKEQDGYAELYRDFTPFGIAKEYL
jgi:hypothetical protein